MSVRIRQALFVIGCPRSGTSILHRALAQHDQLWSPFGESHGVFEGPFAPNINRGESNRVTAGMLDEQNRSQLIEGLWRSTMLQSAGPQSDFATSREFSVRVVSRAKSILRRREQSKSRPNGIYLLEKTPKNCLRVAMLAKLVPNSRFLFLDRDPARTIDSLIAGWRTWDKVGPFRRKRYGTYKIGDSLQIPDFPYPWWCFALTPSWRDLRGATLAEVCAAQYRACNEIALADLSELSRSRVYRIRFEDFQQAPIETAAAALDFAGLSLTPRVRSFLHEHVRGMNPNLRPVSQATAEVVGGVSSVPTLIDQTFRS